MLVFYCYFLVVPTTNMTHSLMDSWHFCCLTLVITLFKLLYTIRCFKPSKFKPWKNINGQKWGYTFKVQLLMHASVQSCPSIIVALLEKMVWMWWPTIHLLFRVRQQQHRASASPNPDFVFLASSIFSQPQNARNIEILLERMSLLLFEAFSVLFFLSRVLFFITFYIFEGSCTTMSWLLSLWMLCLKWLVLLTKKA